MQACLLLAAAAESGYNKPYHTAAEVQRMKMLVYACGDVEAPIFRRLPKIMAQS